jgi:two-component system, LytTR family, response regulator
MIRALIVDDSPLARKGIRLFLEDEADIEVVGEAGDGPDAVAQIAAHLPDLVFMDIQMPGFDAFEVLERSRLKDLRAVIFITAHADYALRAFDSDAVGYLLKPIDPARFRATVQRARLMLRQPDAAETGAGKTLQVALSAQLDLGRRLSRVLVRHGGRFLLIKTEEIDWIEASGEYASLHTGRGTWLLRIPLSELAGRLDENQFARIHRCTIVNLDRVREIQPRSHGDCDVIMHDGNQLRLSRNYRESVFARAV